MVVTLATPSILLFVLNNVVFFSKSCQTKKRRLNHGTTSVVKYADCLLYYYFAYNARKWSFLKLHCVSKYYQIWKFQKVSDQILRKTTLFKTRRNKLPSLGNQWNKTLITFPKLGELWKQSKHVYPVKFWFKKKLLRASLKGQEKQINKQTTCQIFIQTNTCIQHF